MSIFGQFGSDTTLLIKKCDSIDPIALYAAIRKRVAKSFLFESASGPERFAEFSFIGFDPVATFVLKDGPAHGRALVQVRHLLAPHAKELPEFKYIGGLVGYVSYEFVQHLEKISLKPSSFPQLELGLFLDGVVFDHRHGRAFYFSHTEDRSKIITESLEEARYGGVGARRFECDQLRSDQTRAEFEQSVARARESIAAGEVFQIVLSRELKAPYCGDLFDVYRRLRQINPSPYMYFLDFGARKIAGSSPEMLVSVRGRTVQTLPHRGDAPDGTLGRRGRRARSRITKRPQGACRARHAY